MKSHSGPVCRLFARGSFCIFVLLSGLALPAGAGGATISAVYSDSFTQNQDPSAQARQDWVNFRASLIPSAYDTVTISGTFDTTGRTLTDATIVPQIAAALHNATSGAWMVGGITWAVGPSSSEPAALAANTGNDPFVTSCENPGYIVRPNIGTGNFNWGGVNTATCFGQPSQTMTVTFSGSTPLPNYAVSQTKGATIVPGTTDTGNHVDDTPLTAITLPFPVAFYDQVFTSAYVSSNGYLVFTGASSYDFCIPTGNAATDLIAPFSADLDTRDSAGGQGIFTSISGSAPNRIFNIEWRTVRCCGPGAPTVNFEIRLYEGRQHIDFIYGTSTGGVGGIGVQRDTGSEYVSVSCDTPAAPPSGVQYSFAEITITPATVNETTGNVFTGPVAYFTTTRAGAVAGDFTATIDWGDGTTSAAAVTAGTAANTFTVTGTHIYATAGPFTTSIRVTDSVDTHSDVATGSAGQCVTPPMNLVSWWPGDGNAMDIQGTNGGTLRNGATFATGEVGQAFSFNGSNQDVSIGDPDSLKLTTGMTIDAWVYPTSTPGSLAGILTKWNQDVSLSSTADSYALFLNNNNQPLAIVHLADGSEPSVVGSSIPLNAWSHVAATYDAASGVLTIYVNGVAASSTTLSSQNIFASDAPIDIGSEADDGAGRYFPGLIDEVEVFSRALTQSEIQSMYNAGSFGKCKTISLYVSNVGNNTIEKFDASGNDLGTFASSGLNNPYDLAFDFTGNLYAANFISNTVEKFDSAGNDLGTFASSNLDRPFGLAFDASGNLYVANRDSGTIERFDSTGGDLGTFATSVASDTFRLVFDVSGNLYVTNVSAGQVEEFSSGGTDLGAFATSNLHGPLSLTFDRNGFLHVGNSTNNTIEWFDAAATDLGLFAHSGLNQSYGLATDPAGNSYSANYQDSTIEKFDPAGNVSQFANATNSNLNNPVSIAIREAAVAATPTPTAAPTISTTANPSAVTLGTSSVTLKDSAALAGGNNPTGTMTFTLTSPGNATVDTETVTVNGNGTYTTPTGFTLPTSGSMTGTYYWVASYSGDAGNGPVTSGSTDEPVSVTQAGPGISTTAGGNVTLGAGAKLTDSASLSGGYHPTGTITFTLTSPSNTTVDTETVTVNGNGNYTTPTGFTPTQTGNYRWHATYGGDSNNQGATDNGQNETEVVSPAKPPPHQGTANGSGTILTHNNQASFSFNITNNNKKGTPSGTLTYTDTKGGINLTSTAITAINLVNNQATFSGKGTIPGSKPKKPTAVSFTVVATDNGTPGAPKDTFEIQISSPYTADGNLTSGNIVVH